uniref:Uncharacterized protein n=1 Tax=Amphimedon queenslandica TaxID=400682 RepID=A0A1X7VWM4_AMPQE
MTDKEKELQVVNESLRHDLQVARINNQSLQEALLETQSLSVRKAELTDCITELLKEKKQVEEQPKAKIDDFKTTVFEKDAYISKLLKKKSEQQERISFLEEQSIKETSSVEVQFNYLIPSMDNLECLSDVQITEKKLFLIQGDKPQLMNWEKYGLRIGVQEDSLLSSETVEAAVVALVGGQFQFPPNTVLVSAVYAVSLSKPLLKPLQLEIQHCIDLAGRPDLGGYLKFAIAPVNTPSLPYQFTLVEGGEFRSDSWYGSIKRKNFCLVCILGKESTNEGGNGLPIASVNGDTEEGEEEQQPQQETNNEEEEEEVQQIEDEEVKQQEKEEGEEKGQFQHEEEEEVQQKQEGEEEEEHKEEDEDEGEDDDSSSDSSSDSNKANITTEASKVSIVKKKIEEKGKEQINENSSTRLIAGHIPSIQALIESKNKTEVLTKPSTGSDYKDEVHSTSVKEAINYAGLLYYEEKGVEDLVTFTAAKKLNALLEHIKKECPQAKRGLNICFHIASPDGFVELNLNTPQKKSYEGWTIEPQIEPCRLYQDDINNFGDEDYPLPPSCPISVYGSPHAVPILHYSIPLEGVARPFTLYIHRSLRTTNPSTSSSSSNTITEVTPISSNGGASVPVQVDVKRVKKVINNVLVSHHASLTSLKTSLSDLASQLYTAGLISDEVKETRSMDTFITEFKASLSFMRKLPQVQEHCQKFLSSFIAVRGSCANAAIALTEDWIEAIKNELGFDLNI